MLVASARFLFSFVSFRLSLAIHFRLSSLDWRPNLDIVELKSIRTKIFLIEIWRILHDLVEITVIIRMKKKTKSKWKVKRKEKWPIQSMLEIMNSFMHGHSIPPIVSMWYVCARWINATHKQMYKCDGKQMGHAFISHRTKIIIYYLIWRTTFLYSTLWLPPIPSCTWLVSLGKWKFFIYQKKKKWKKETKHYQQSWNGENVRTEAKIKLIRSKKTKQNPK